MYDYITGKIAEISPTFLVLENMGIGYHINISLQTFTEISSQEEVKIYVHQYLVRDDLPVFYGFYTKSERDLFRLLIAVSGVGANTARTILSTFSNADLVTIISTGNSTMLKSVKGLGAKTSEKVIVELRDKMSGVDLEAGSSSITSQVESYDENIFNEAISALTMLGFAKAASAKVVKAIISNNPTAKVEDIIRLSLKKL